MSFCSLLLPLLVAAVPSAADTVAVALFCDTESYWADALVNWPYRMATAVRREDCDAGRAASRSAARRILFMKLRNDVERRERSTDSRCAVLRSCPQ